MENVTPINAVQLIFEHINKREIEQASALIGEMQRKGVDLRSVATKIATELIAAFPWDVISSLLPERTNFFQESGWIESVSRGIPIDKSGNPIPWMNYSLLDFITPRLKAAPDVFEWGSGYSTLWWGTHGGQVSSVEDSADWYGSVIKLTENLQNIKVTFRRDMKSYVESVCIKHWDMIQIDGSHRNECAIIAPDYLKPEGIILFDNSDSPGYSGGVAHLMDRGFYRIDFFGLIPTLPYKNCTSIFFRDLNLIKFHTPPNNHSPIPAGLSCFQAILGIDHKKQHIVELRN